MSVFHFSVLSFFFLTFVQSVLCLAFISFTVVNLDAMEKRLFGLNGRCPAVLPGRVGHCAELCGGLGGGCSRGKICCSTGCGSDCMFPGKCWICFSLTLQ